METPESPKVSGRAERITVLIPAPMARTLDRISQRRGLSRSAMMRTLCADLVQREADPAARDQEPVR